MGLNAIIINIFSVFSMFINTLSINTMLGRLDAGDFSSCLSMIR